jgi:hypothetical protein
MTSAKGPGQLGLAYFAMRQTSDKQGYVGAILVLDERGIPKEFRCTHPIRPTLVQKSLYGANLETHVSLDLFGKPLVNALTTKPIACLVETRRLLGLRELVSLPILHVLRLGETLSAESGATANAQSNAAQKLASQKMNSTYDGFQPVSVSWLDGFENDFGATKAGLEQVFRYIDLVEPFERISTALTVLAERDDRFR